MKRKQNGQLIFKAVILLLSLIVIVFVASLAWFTYGSTAYADGINIRSKADGVEVSWDGENFYYDLTERDPIKVTGKTGLALNISGKDGVPASLKLVTGNGLDFFEPYLNRRTGTILQKNNVWEGIQINENNSTGKYIDIPLYFRSSTQRDVYLAGDSKVLPKDENARISNYGPFSKDYIAAASRVAFLDYEKKNCSFIWAPNADIELVENESGYTRYTTTKDEEITVSGGGTDIDGGVVDDGKTYYMWTFYDDAVVSDYQQNLNKFEARKFEYNSKYRYFTTQVTMYLPTYGGDNPSIPFFVNESSTKPSGSAVHQYNKYVDGEKSSQTLREDLGQFFVVTDTEFNVGDAAFSNALKIVRSQIKVGSKITFEVGYDPVNKLLVMLNYQVEGGGSFNLGGEGADITTTITYYPLGENGDVDCALVSPLSSIAVSTGVNYTKAVLFRDDSTKNNVLPISITTSEQFTAIMTGTGYTATYKFKNTANKQTEYLYVNNNGEVSFGSTGSDFTLYYNSEFNGPILKTGDYFLVVQGGILKTVTLGQLNTAEAVTVYTGSSYQLNKNLSTDSQEYQYYDYESSGLVNLSDNSTPKLFTSSASTPDTTKIGNTKVATLTKETDDAEYYTATIVMRIWVEGTDREAKTPLADGIFDASFHFISQ